MSSNFYGVNYDIYNLTYAMADTDIFCSDTSENDVALYADTTQHYGLIAVDSNEWTKIDSVKKKTDHIYLSAYIGKMWESNNGVQGYVVDKKERLLWRNSDHHIRKM